MKKIIIDANHTLQLQAEDKGIQLQNGMVKVRVNACGICGSDLALLNGTRDIKKECSFPYRLYGDTVI